MHLGSDLLSAATAAINSADAPQYFAIIYGQEAKLDASLQETDQKLQKIPQSWDTVRKHLTEEPLLTEMFCSYLKELCAKRCEVSRDLARFTSIGVQISILLLENVTVNSCKDNSILDSGNFGSCYHLSLGI